MNNAVKLILVVLVLAGAAYLFRFKAVDGRVASVNGTATAVINGREQAVSVGMAVPAGTTIRTQNGAQVVVELKENVQARVGENAEATVSELGQNRFNSAYAIGLDLQRGEILNRVDALPEGSSYQVRTATAVCGVRGTRFGVHATAEGAEFSVLEGSLVVKFGDQERTLTNDQIISIYRDRPATDIRQMTERQRQRLRPCGYLNFNDVVNAARAMANVTQTATTFRTDIEAFAATHDGRYPESLVELYGSEKNDMFGRPYIYRRTGNNKYFLASMGEDGIPGNGDDVIITQ